MLSRRAGLSATAKLSCFVLTSAFSKFFMKIHARCVYSCMPPTVDVRVLVGILFSKLSFYFVFVS